MAKGAKEDFLFNMNPLNLLFYFIDSSFSYGNSPKARHNVFTSVYWNEGEGLTVM
jgi:hypothetical protein